MAEVGRRCIICGEMFFAKTYNAKYCSDECRKIAHQSSEDKRNERRKAQRHMKNALEHKPNKLDERLQEARDNGLTYAELQVQKTLEKTRKGEL